MAVVEEESWTFALFEQDVTGKLVSGYFSCLGGTATFTLWGTTVPNLICQVLGLLETTPPNPSLAGIPLRNS